MGGIAVFEGNKYTAPFSNSTGSSSGICTVLNLRDIEMERTDYPEQFSEFLAFLCKKYRVDKTRLSVEYSSKSPPPLKGDRPGYYEGLLSFREKDGQLEFLITVFKASRDPLLTLAHEFGHLVKNLKSGNFDRHMRPPNDAAERTLDEQALNDLAEFRELNHS
jgi:hypothetical protein